MLVPGGQRTLAAATLVNSIGRGVFLTAGVLYFTESVRLPAAEVGIGLSLAGVASLAAGFPVGHLADRYGPRRIYLATLLCGTAAMTAYALVRDFWGFLVVVAVGAIAHTAGLAARGPLIAHYGGDRPQEFRGYLRSVTNVGIALGALLAGWAVQVGTRAAYLTLILAAAGFFLVSVIVAVRLPAVSPVPRRNGHRSVAFRDLPYLGVTILDGILAIQFRVLTVAVPLWLVTRTSAPRWTIAAAMLVNTFMVGLLQARFSRNVASPLTGAGAMRRAGIVFLISCAVISLSGGAPTWVATGLLLTGVVAHTVGELWHAAGGFELSFGLAPRHAIGQYQGVFGMGSGLADALGPALVTLLCIQWGTPGWYVLGALLALTGLMVPVVVRRAGLPGRGRGIAAGAGGEPRRGRVRPVPELPAGAGGGARRRRR